jgi:hypothetical protein
MKGGTVRGVVIFASDHGDTGETLLAFPCVPWFQTLFAEQLVDIRIKVVGESKK